MSNVRKIIPKTMARDAVVDADPDTIQLKRRPKSRVDAQATLDDTQESPIRPIPRRVPT
jgi:hypothetical protein